MLASFNKIMKNSRKIEMDTMEEMPLKKFMQTTRNAQCRKTSMHLEHVRNQAVIAGLKVSHQRTQFLLELKKHIRWQ